MSCILLGTKLLGSFLEVGVHTSIAGLQGLCDRGCMLPGFLCCFVDPLYWRYDAFSYRGYGSYDDRCLTLFVRGHLSWFMKLVVVLGTKLLVGEVLVGIVAYRGGFLPFGGFPPL